MNLTSGNFRIQGDLIGNIIKMSFVTLLLIPNNTILKRAIYLGIFTVLLDGILETLAYYHIWWIAELGSTYPPINPVPIEMIGSFLFIGISAGIVFSVPEIIRQINYPPLNWLKNFFLNPHEDWVWVLAVFFFIVIGGALADWSSILAGIYVPGPGWGLLIVAFVWLVNGFLSVIAFFILRKIFGSGSGTTE